MPCYTVLCLGNNSCFPMLQVPIQHCFLFLLFHFEAETAPQHFDSRLLLVFVVNIIRVLGIEYVRQHYNLLKSYEEEKLSELSFPQN